MSANLPEKSIIVHSFLQQSLEKSRAQDTAMQLMINHIKEIESNVINVEKNVESKFTKVSEMVQRVEDSVTLIYAEEKNLQSAVYAKSTNLAKDRFAEEDDEFNKVVGKYRRMIWSKLKNKFQVPRYNCIRRIDFADAVMFVESFNPEDYL